MTSILEDHLERCIEKLKTAENVLKSAEKAYRKKPSRENLIALKAANRLVKESTALAGEWTTI